MKLMKTSIWRIKVGIGKRCRNENLMNCSKDYQDFFIFEVGQFVKDLLTTSVFTILT